MDRRTIALFGSYKPRPKEAAYELAHEIGLQLGRAGFDLINGGHDGTMAASAQGARQAGARVTGVTCASLRGARRVRVNRFVHQAIEAANLFLRIEIMMRRAGGYVIMDGGTGTLAELGVIWEHVNKALITPRPIVCVGEFWKPTVNTVTGAYPAAKRNVRFVQSAEEVVSIMSERAVQVDPEDQAFLAGAVVK